MIHPRTLSPTFKAAGFAEVAVSNCSGLRDWGLLDSRAYIPIELARLLSLQVLISGWWV